MLSIARVAFNFTSTLCSVEWDHIFDLLFGLLAVLLVVCHSQCRFTFSSHHPTNRIFQFVSIRCKNVFVKNDQIMHFDKFWIWVRIWRYPDVDVTLPVCNFTAFIFSFINVGKLWGRVNSNLLHACILICWRQQLLLTLKCVFCDWCLLKDLIIVVIMNRFECFVYTVEIFPGKNVLVPW